MANKKDMMAFEPAKKTKNERMMWRAIELIPESSGYSSEVKLNAVMIYATCGSIRKTSQVSGIPRITLVNWTQSDWWPEVLPLALELTNKKFSAKLNGIMSMALDNLEDILENGEEVLTKTTTVTKKGRESITETRVVKERKKLSGKDLMNIAGNAADKQFRMQQAEKENSRADIKTTLLVSERLTNIAKTLGEAGKSKTIEGELDNGTIESEEGGDAGVS